MAEIVSRVDIGRGADEGSLCVMTPRVTIRVGITGHGFGKMIAPMVSMQASKEVPESCAKLKKRLEND